MSTYQKPDDSQEWLSVHVDLAEHAVGQDQFKAFEDLCGRTLRSTPMLGYLAHYTSNVFNLGVDKLAEPPGEPHRVPATTGRDELRRVGRSLCFAIGRLDDELTAAHAGALLRMLLHTTTGAAFCNAVAPGQNAVGFVLDTTPRELLTEIVDQRSTDVAMASLVTAMRQLCFTSSEPTSAPPDMSARPAVDTGPAPDPSSVHVTEFTGLSDESQQVLTACRKAVKSASLHLVSRCTDGEIAFIADCFDDESLRPFFTQLSADARRKFYLTHAREVGAVATTLGRAVHTAMGGGLLLRMVLDVEQGSIYYYRICPGDYLIGVTVNPNAVSQADEEMAKLTKSVTNLLDR